ncbi:hypothetical protein KRP22_004815 [Phytophthora ramorum]|nr:hypothetical protein KRP22_10447 [Phytophthora ramorum]
MKKDRFTANPFPEVRVSEREQKELISLVDIYVDDYLKKYEHFTVVDKHQINMRRWEHVKSKDNLHVYTERTRKELQRNGMSPENSLSATQRLQADSVKPDLPVMLSVGSFVGEMDDLMFGVVNPTLDSMRIKASCMSESTHWNAQEVARDQVSIYETCASFESRTVYSALSLLETSMSSFDEENWRDV